MFLFAFCVFSLVASDLLLERVMVTRCLSLALPIRASVVFESTEEAMEKIYVASSDGSASLTMDEALSDLMWVLKTFLIPNEGLIDCNCSVRA